jgi:hypothetical protein
LIARFKREHEKAPLVHATIVSQRYPSVKISNRRSTADARSGATVGMSTRSGDGAVQACRLHVVAARMIRCGWWPLARALRPP